MASYDLEGQEQIDSIKTWWKMYGNLVTGVVVAGSVAVIGWQGWNWHQRSQSAQASAIYGVLEQAVVARDAQKVKAAAGELAEKFGGTSYAGENKKSIFTVLNYILPLQGVLASWPRSSAVPATRRWAPSLPPASRSRPAT